MTYILLKIQNFYSFNHIIIRSLKRFVKGKLVFLIRQSYIINFKIELKMSLINFL